MVGPNKRKIQVVTRREIVRATQKRGHVARDVDRIPRRHITVNNTDYELDVSPDEKAATAMAILRAAECERLAHRAIECADACDSLRKSAAAATSGGLRDMLLRAAMDQLQAAFAHVDRAARTRARLAETSTRGETIRVVIDDAREHYVGVHLGLQKAVSAPLQ